MPIDRLTLQLHIQHEFQKRGITPTPQELQSAINNLEQKQIREERSYLPVGERLYRSPDIGRKASVVNKELITQLKSMTKGQSFLVNKVSTVATIQ